MNSSTKSKRILKELKILIQDPDVQSYFYYESSRKAEDSQKLYIYGYVLPRTAPYKYGSYKVCITIPENYPFKEPVVQLLTYIYHPAVSNDISVPTVCTCCPSNQWSPSFLISKMIENFVNVIDQPEAAETYCLMNSEAKTLFNQNRTEYDKKALAMVEKYSCPRPNPSIISLKFAAKRMICKQLYFDSEKLNQLPLSNSLKQYLHSSLDKS